MILSCCWPAVPPAAAWLGSWRVRGLGCCGSHWNRRVAGGLVATFRAIRRLPRSHGGHQGRRRALAAGAAAVRRRSFTHRHLLLCGQQRRQPGWRVLCGSQRLRLKLLLAQLLALLLGSGQQRRRQRRRRHSRWHRLRLQQLKLLHEAGGRLPGGHAGLRAEGGGGGARGVSPAERDCRICNWQYSTHTRICVRSCCTTQAGSSCLHGWTLLQRWAGSGCGNNAG